MPNSCSSKLGHFEFLTLINISTASLFESVIACHFLHIAEFNWCPWRDVEPLSFVSLKHIVKPLVISEHTDHCRARKSDICSRLTDRTKLCNVLTPKPIRCTPQTSVWLVACHWTLMETSKSWTKCWKCYHPHQLKKRNAKQNCCAI